MSKYEDGLEIARRLWGEGRARRVEEALEGLSPGFREYVIESLAIYARPGLDAKTRSLCTLAALTVLGRHDELRLHVIGAVNNGATPEEIKEVLLQMAVYGGVPAAIGGFSMAKKTLEQMAEKGEIPKG